MMIAEDLNIAKKDVFCKSNGFKVNNFHDSMQKTAKIYVAGHKGLVGSAITRALQKQGFNNLVFRTKEELDLMDQEAVYEFFSQESPCMYFWLRLLWKGIKRNSHSPADFILSNLAIQTNVISASHKHNIKKLLF